MWGRWPVLIRLCLDVSHEDALTLQCNADCSEHCLFADLLVKGLNSAQLSSDDDTDGDDIKGHDDGVSAQISSNTAVRSVRFEVRDYLPEF